MRATYQIAAVIPTFNRARLLRRAIESVLNQSVPPSQIIVVDDGSSDNTAEVCRAYAGRLKYVWQENAGAAAARNLGVQLTGDPWVAFLDSDDYWSRWHLERMVSAISRTGGEAALYFSDVQIADGDGSRTHWERIGFRPRAPHDLVRDASSWVLMNPQPTMIQSSVISKHALDRIGGFDVRFRHLLEDSHLFCRMGIGGVACAVAGVGAVATWDDASSVRLTTGTPLNSEKGQAHAYLLWSDILFNKAELPSEFCRLVRYYLAGTYWGTGRILLRSGRYARGAANLTKALIVEPHLALWMLRHGTQKGYEAAVRPASEITSPKHRSLPARARFERVPTNVA